MSLCHLLLCLLGPLLVLCSSFFSCLPCVAPLFKAFVFFPERRATALDDLWPFFFLSVFMLCRGACLFAVVWSSCCA